MLLPYESHLRQHTSIPRKWTSKDTAITAGDVYTALETPPVFRLRFDLNSLSTASVSFSYVGIGIAYSI